MKFEKYATLMQAVTDRDRRQINLIEADRILAELRGARDPIGALRGDLRSKVIPPDTKTYHSPDEWERSKAAEMDARVLETGNWFLGHSDRRMNEFIGSVGLDLLDRTIADLETLIRQERESRSKGWPAPYRYRGVFGPGPAGQKVPVPACVVDDRVLAPGDVVMLTEAQALGWADRFDPVSDEEAVVS